MLEKPAHQTHLSNAIDETKEGSLLERNLVNHFGQPGQNLASLKSTLAKARN